MSEKITYCIKCQSKQPPLYSGNAFFCSTYERDFKYYRVNCDVPDPAIHSKIPKKCFGKYRCWNNVRTQCDVSDACAIKAIQEHAINLNDSKYKHLREKLKRTSNLMKETNFHKIIDI